MGGGKVRLLTTAEAKRETQRRWYAKHREEKIAYHRERRLKGVDATRNSHLRLKYGITIAQYDELLRLQDGVCASCHKPETSLSRIGTLRRLSVDHDHVTGLVRGLLCCNCNRALGWLDDSPDKIQALLIYRKGYS